MIALFGDPHGDFSAIGRALAKGRPAASVFVGDMDLERPFEQEAAPLEECGRVWFIHGNHDTDREHWHDFLFGSKLADRNLSGRVREIEGLRFAGLGGVFRQKVWHPKNGEGKPEYRTREEFVRANRTSRWRGGLPLGHRSTIFPEDLDTLGDLRADVLVTHEAPSCHRYGFEEIDLVAEAMGAKLVVHGHHHHRYADVLPSGIPVLGLGKADLVTAEAEELLAPGWAEKAADEKGNRKWTHQACMN